MALTIEQKNALPGILATKERITEQYLGKKGVTGVGVGFKIKGAVTTKELAILFFVEKKSNIAGDELLPTNIEGCPVDVIQSSFSDIAVGKDEGESAGALRVDPIIGGVQITPKDGRSFGTLGVVATSAGSKVLLTCSHVVNDQTGVEIDQPAPKAIGSNVCATVSAAVKGNISYAGSQCYVDAAIATHNTFARDFKANTVYPSSTVGGSQEAIPGETVTKQGAKTGQTSSTVASVSTTITTPSGNRYYNVIAINGAGGFSEGGDSGSVILNANAYVVGLLIGESGGFTIASNIAPVMSAMNIVI